MSLNPDEIRALAVRMTGRSMRSYERIRRKQRWWRYGVSLFYFPLIQAWWFWIEPNIHRHDRSFAIAGAVVLWLVICAIWFIGYRVLEAQWRGWKRRTDDLWSQYEQARKEEA